MRKFLFVVGCGMLWLVLASCGRQAQLVPLDNVIDFNQPEARCSTGRHAFRGIKALCRGLQDEATNNHCAQAQRKSLFTSKGCPGTFTPY